jgi:hypothetical protein
MMLLAVVVQMTINQCTFWLLIAAMDVVLMMVMIVEVILWPLHRELCLRTASLESQLINWGSLRRLALLIPCVVAPILETRDSSVTHERSDSTREPGWHICKENLTKSSLLWR